MRIDLVWAGGYWRRVQRVPGIAIARLQAHRKLEQLFAMSGVNVIVLPVTV